MNTVEKGNQKGNSMEIFKVLSGKSFEEKSVYDPSAKSHLLRLKRCLEQGNVGIASLSSLLQGLGLDECAKGMEAERDELIQSVRDFLNPYVGLLNERIATLPLYFLKQYEHWERMCRDDPEHAGHFTNNARISEAISTRKGLAKLDILGSFDESEFEDALPWLQRTIKLVTNAEIHNALQDGRDEIEVKSGLQNLLEFLVKWCPNADISPEDLNFGSEDKKRKIEKMLRKNYQEFVQKAPDAQQRLQQMTAKINAAMGLALSSDEIQS